MRSKKYRVRAITWHEGGYGETSHSAYFRTREEAEADVANLIKQQEQGHFIITRSTPDNVTILDRISAWRMEIEILPV